MKQRSYRGNSDRRLMIELVNRFPAENLHVTDLPYRLSSWALDDLENISLWFDANRQLVAWACLQTPFWTIDYAFMPDAGAELHRELLAWAETRVQSTMGTPFGHPCWFINVFLGQPQRMRDLEAAGFRCQSDVGENSWSKVLMCRSLPTPVKVYRPPASFVVRTIAGESDVEAYVDLHQTTFETKNMTVAWRRRVLEQPAYQLNLDMVVESPQGQLAAFCICWQNENGIDGHVEPLGCHPDFRRYALGRVALSEGLRRLQALGVKNIYVETDNYRNTAFQLYESFDFQVIRDVLVYRKDYAPENKKESSLKL